MKKLMSIVLAGAMISTMSVCAFAYDTDVSYSTNLEKIVDADGDGNEDGTITDETPYILVVPEELTVDGESKPVFIAGVVDEAVSVTVAPVTSMRDEIGNSMNANIGLENGPLVLPISLTEVGRANTSISASWTQAPMTGSWTGNFEYIVS